MFSCTGPESGTLHWRGCLLRTGIKGHVPVLRKAVKSGGGRAEQYDSVFQFSSLRGSSISAVLQGPCLHVSLQAEQN